MQILPLAIQWVHNWLPHCEKNGFGYIGTILLAWLVRYFYSYSKTSLMQVSIYIHCLKSYRVFNYHLTTS